MYNVKAAMPCTAMECHNHAMKCQSRFLYFSLLYALTEKERNQMHSIPLSGHEHGTLEAFPDSQVLVCGTLEAFPDSQLVVS